MFLVLDFVCPAHFVETFTSMDVNFDTLKTVKKLFIYHTPFVFYKLAMIF